MAAWTSARRWRALGRGSSVNPARLTPDRDSCARADEATQPAPVSSRSRAATSSAVIRPGFIRAPLYPASCRRRSAAAGVAEYAECFVAEFHPPHGAVGRLVFPSAVLVHHLPLEHAAVRVGGGDSGGGHGRVGGDGENFLGSEDPWAACGDRRV